MAPTRTSSSLRSVARWELTLQQHTTAPKPAAPPPVQAVALAVQQRCPCRPPLRQHAAAGQVCGGAQARAHRALPIRRDEAQAAGSGALAAFLQGQRRMRQHHTCHFSAVKTQTPPAMVVGLRSTSTDCVTCWVSICMIVPWTICRPCTTCSVLRCAAPSGGIALACLTLLQQ